MLNPLCACCRDTREYADGSLCVVCHTECRPVNGSASCHGPVRYVSVWWCSVNTGWLHILIYFLQYSSPCVQGADHCTECENSQDGEFCVDHCPSGVKEDQQTVWKYRNASGHCLPCSTNCSLSWVDAHRTRRARCTHNENNLTPNVSLFQLHGDGRQRLPLR